MNDRNKRIIKQFSTRILAVLMTFLFMFSTVAMAAPLADSEEFGNPDEFNFDIPNLMLPYGTEGEVTVVIPFSNSVPNIHGGFWAAVYWDGDLELSPSVVFGGNPVNMAVFPTVPGFAHLVLASGPAEALGNSGTLTLTAIIPPGQPLGLVGNITIDVVSATARPPGNTPVRGISEGSISLVEEPIEVTYRFVAGTGAPALPQEVLALLPTDRIVELGSNVTPTAPAQTSVRGDGGVWRFASWAPGSHANVTDDVEFVGTWTFIEDLPVTYSFVDYEGADLPASVMNLLPTARTVEYESNVTPTAPAQTAVPGEGGTWIFRGWSPASVPSATGPVSFVGTWEFTEDPPVDVTYVFVSDIEGQTLPSGVIDLLPANRQVPYGTTEVTPSPFEAVDVPDTVGNITGIWRFVEWNPESQSAVDVENIIFAGTWRFIETFPILHNFVSLSDGIPLPDSISALLPEDGRSAAVGDIARPTGDFSGYVSLVQGGMWRAIGGWNPLEQLVLENHGAVTFTQSWRFYEVETVDVTFRFEPQENLPPEILELIPENRLVVSGETLPYEDDEFIFDYVVVEGGRWVFEGWSPEIDQPITEDTEFVGTWRFVEDIEVVYEFESGTEGRDLPSSVIALLPDARTVPYGQEVTPTAPAETVVSVENGRWTFRGWDPTSETATESPVLFTGTWTFELRILLDFVSGTPAHPTLPDSVEVLLPDDVRDMYVEYGTTPDDPETTVVRVPGGEWRFIEWVEREDGYYGFRGVWRFYADPPTGGNGGVGGGGGGAPVAPPPPTTIIPDDDDPPLAMFSPYHNAFLVGFPDGTIRPHGTFTRAEAVTVLFRLLSDEFRAENWSQSNPFGDVEMSHWFNNAVSTMTNAGIVQGSPGGSFRPNDAITRAEFAAMIARFFSEFSATENAFSDIEGNWAEDYINLVAQFGIVQGVGNGAFNPDALLARNEAAAMVNRMLDRILVGPEGLLEGRTRWPDKTNMNAWYYLYMQEATHSTTFERVENNQLTWTTLLPHLDWTVLERPTSTPGQITVARRIQMQTEMVAEAELETEEEAETQTAS